MTPNPETINIPTRPENLGASDRQNSSWDIRNAPKNYVWLIATQALLAIFSFASVWLVTRYLGAEGYGAVLATIATSQFVQIFVNWSIPSLSRFGIEEFVETGKITRSFWARGLIFFPNLILVLIATYFWLDPVTIWLGLSGAAVFWISVHILAFALWMHVQNALQAVKLLRRQGMFLASERIITFFLLLAVILTNQISWQSVLLCYIVPAALMSTIGLISIRSFVELDHFFDRVQFRKMLTYSLPLIVFAAVAYLSSGQLDSIFIAKLLSKKDLGIYSIAAQINLVAFQIPMLANSILLSLFVTLLSARDLQTINAFFRHLVPSLTLAWGFFCHILALIAVLLIPIVFGEEFRSAGKPLWILLAASSVSVPYLFGYASYSFAISATYIQSVGAAIAAAVNVSLDILLIPRFGIVGCALATFFAFLSIAITVVYLCKLKFDLPVSWTFQAVLPSFVGLIAMLYFDSPMLAFSLFSVAALVTAVIYRNSITQSYSVIAKQIEHVN